MSCKEQESTWQQKGKKWLYSCLPFNLRKRLQVIQLESKWKTTSRVFLVWIWNWIWIWFESEFLEEAPRRETVWVHEGKHWRKKSLSHYISAICHLCKRQTSYNHNILNGKVMRGLHLRKGRRTVWWQVREGFELQEFGGSIQIIDFGQSHLWNVSLKCFADFIAFHIY